MSSVIAHIATGAAIYLARPQRPVMWPPRRAATRGALACVALAVLPDLDYLAWWVLHLHIEPRITHSLVFCIASAALAWLLLRWRPGASAAPPPFITLLLAACSHLVLDFSVGVHGLPLLWPLLPGEFAATVGILPSAGRLALGNFYLWRNLLIETGVLWPLLALLVVLGRGRQRCLRSPLPWLLLPPWLLCLAWSLSLSR